MRRERFSRATTSRAPAPAALERLESRRLTWAEPSAALVGDRLVIRGTDAADTISVTLDAVGFETYRYAVTIAPATGAALSQTFPETRVRRVAVAAGPGDDQISVSPPGLSYTPFPRPGRRPAIHNRVNAGDGNDTVLGGSGIDLLIGGRGDDRLDGGAGRDVVIGSAGNDRIVGSDGDDLLTGGPGDDELNGAAGNDTLLGGTGNDVLGAIDSDIAGGPLEDEPGNDHLIGGAGDDDLRGGAGLDTLLGGAGNDLVSGMDGTDRLRGGRGADRFFNRDDEDEHRDFTPGVDELRGLPVFL